MDDIGELEERRRRLQLCADAQRRELASRITGLVAPLGSVDRRIGALRRWMGHPVAIGLVVIVALVVGRHAPAGRIGALASIASAGWGLRRFIAGDPPREAGGRRP